MITLTNPKISDLSKQQALGFKLQSHPVTDVVYELLQSEELDSAQRAPIPPEHANLQLPRLV